MSEIVRKFLYAIIFCVASYAIAIANFYFIDRFDVEASERTGDLASARAAREAEESLVERVAQEGGVEAFVRAAFVPKGDLVPFIESLESRARALRLTPEVISANDTAGTAENPAIVATISVAGSRADVDAYVRSLDTLPYHVTVRSVSLAVSEGKWIATVTVSAYVLPDSVTNAVIQSKR